MGCIGLIGNDFGSLELRRRGVGRPDAELDALFELSVPAEPDALVEISAPIFGRPASLGTFKPRTEIQRAVREMLLCCDARCSAVARIGGAAFAMQAKDHDLLEWLCIRAGDYLDQRQGLILRHRKRPQASSKPAA